MLRAGRHQQDRYVPRRRGSLSACGENPSRSSPASMRSRRIRSQRPPWSPSCPSASTAIGGAQRVVVGVFEDSRRALPARRDRRRRRERRCREPTAADGIASKVVVGPYGRARWPSSWPFEYVHCPEWKAPAARSSWSTTTSPSGGAGRGRSSRRASRCTPRRTARRRWTGSRRRRPALCRSPRPDDAGDGRTDVPAAYEAPIHRLSKIPVLVVSADARLPRADQDARRQRRASQADRAGTA